MTRPAISSRRALALFLLVALPVALLGLGATDVVTMEGIVADGARTMARTGELAVPRLHDEIYTYKPPLAYWLALGSFSLFGEQNAWTLRLPFALSGVAMGLAILWLIGAALGWRAGLLTALASTTGALTLQKMRLAEFDMPLAAGVGVAVAASCRALADERPAPWLWPLAYAGLAFAFLAKGMPALMVFAPGLLAAAWALGRLRRLFTLPHLAGVALFAALVGAWVLAAYAAEGAAAFAQPLAEARDKGTVWTGEALVQTLAKPVVVLGLFAPWALVIPLTARRLLRRERGPIDDANTLYRAALAFAAAGTATFMLVPATETRYFLPLAAPVGIAAGIALLRVRRARASLYVLVATVALLAAVQILAIEPHRASSRSQRQLAERFAAHLAPNERVWAFPVSGGFHHSSLSFYLGHTPRTLTPEALATARPGDRVVLYSNEPPWLDDPLPFPFRVLERGATRDRQLALIEIAGAASTPHRYRAPAAGT